jgi:RNA polymerase sigma factor (sigma-70 family)
MFLCGNRELLESFRRGEPDALARVYEHYFPLVANLVSKGFSFESGGQALRFRGAGTSPDAFDLVHDVFAALFEEGARRAYGGTVPYAAYVTTVARNRIISRLRRDKARLLESLDGDGGDRPRDVVDGTPSAEQQLMSRQMEALVQQYMSEQTEVVRALGRCRFADDMSQEQTAAALGLSRKQVRRLEAKLRRGLLDRLKRTSPRAAGGLVGLVLGGMV